MPLAIALSCGLVSNRHLMQCQGSLLTATHLHLHIHIHRRSLDDLRRRRRPICRAELRPNWGTRLPLGLPIALYSTPSESCAASHLDAFPLSTVPMSAIKTLKREHAPAYPLRFNPSRSSCLRNGAMHLHLVVHWAGPVDPFSHLHASIQPLPPTRAQEHVLGLQSWYP
jgi:hypothetical protein